MSKVLNSQGKKGAGVTLFLAGGVILLIVGLFGWLTKSPWLWVVGGVILASGLGLIGGKKKSSGGSAILVAVLWVIFANFLKGILWLIGVVALVGGVILFITGKTRN